MSLFFNKNRGMADFDFLFWVLGLKMFALIFGIIIRN
ncbi:hypothetical protein FUAX_35950 [Fulvitalea axinellae]|uniref:Uncharacterized protein n=1 Tax=Fulvitalea axinellae TaxID=1182444 RepID=A0AAU9CSS1_9BACT|nr:hypothetical protein FUAX_35950 [Fulvitalea axinellae]